MAYTGMHAADIVVVVLYFAFVMAVGLSSMCRSIRSNAHGYFLAGRTMAWFPVGASLFAANIGTGHFIGLTGTGAASGISAAAYEAMGVFALMFLGWVFLPVYVSAGVYTMPEYLHKRYGGQRLRVSMSILSLFMYIFSKISVDVYAGAVFIQHVFNCNIYLAIVILLCITGIHTMVGGLSAVIYMDTLQTTVMVIGGLALTAISLNKVGGLEELKTKYMQAIPSTHLDDNITGCGRPREDAFHIMRDPIDSDQPWPGTIMGIFVIMIWYWCIDQMIIQRALAAKSVTHAKGGSLIAGYLKLLPLFLMIIPGMISRTLFPDEVACVNTTICKEVCGTEVGCSNIAYPKLVMELMPRGVRGLMVSVVMASLMSGLMSMFNSGSTVFTMDIWRRIRREASNTELMIVGRIVIAVLLTISILWIPIVSSGQSGQLFMYIMSMQAYFSPPIFTCFVMGVLWRRTNEKGAFAGFVCGMMMGVTRMLLDIIYPAPPCGSPETRPAVVYKVHFLYYNMIETFVSVVVTVVVSLLTKAPSKESVMGTTYFTRREAVTGQNIDDQNGVEIVKSNGEISSITNGVCNGIATRDTDGGAKYQKIEDQNGVEFTNGDVEMTSLTTVVRNGHVKSDLEEDTSTVKTNGIGQLNGNEELTPMTSVVGNGHVKIKDPEMDTPSENQTQKWKRFAFWFCGYDPEEKNKTPDKILMNTSIVEVPGWRRFVLVNMIILTGLNFLFFGYFW